MGKLVMAYDNYRTNGELILACASLGYLRKEWATLDPTWGRGTFWSDWRPDLLVGHDLDAELSPTGTSVDATALPYPDHSWDALVIDPPYKLNGTPDETVDARYGVGTYTNWRDRMKLMTAMLREGNRVYNGNGFLLFKCMDQVCSGKIRWQTDIFTEQARALGLGKVDRLEYASYRPQPKGTKQVTARRNSSTMLVFKRGWNSL